VANARTNNITIVTVGSDGALEVLDNVATGRGAIDVAVTPDSGFLYSLAGGDDSISIFQIYADGTLFAQPALTGVPPQAAGLVAR
jgi:DNA-binding beta-propeller fold protein YncE